MSMRVLPMGVGAVLVEDPPGDPAAWANGLRTLGLAGVVEVVPAAATVLVKCDDDPALRRAIGEFERIEVTGVESHGDVVTIDVTYDGEDLDDIAVSTGLDVDDVIALHSGVEYRVAFCGFAPGFGYLTGLPEELHGPRRSSPRTRVPAGSVAIAAQYSAVYPRSSPGGWHLIGRTDHVMFDVDRTPASTLRPGATVRFVPRR